MLRKTNFSRFLTLLAISWTIVSGQELPVNYVHSGLVPIFGDVTHNPPLTFTFTTPSPQFVTRPSYFVNIQPPSESSVENLAVKTPVGVNNANSNSFPPAAMPINSPNTYSNLLQEPQQLQQPQQPQQLQQPQLSHIPQLPQEPQQPQQQPFYGYAISPSTAPSIIPSEIQQGNLNNPYSDIFNKMGQSWKKLKDNLVNSGIDRDWFGIFKKLSNTVQPYVNSLSQHLGEVLNTAISQHKNPIPQQDLTLDRMQSSLINNQQPASETVGRFLDTLFHSGPANRLRLL
uniref:DUF148 domain-containing protein n=1 Tax=Syphacia muris TaxID=451379 RepID=A0A0N5AXE9_9BILA